MCVYACVFNTGIVHNELYTHTHTHTNILIPFADSKPMGLKLVKVDTAIIPTVIKWAIHYAAL